MRRKAGSLSVDPVAESKAADEYGDSGNQAIEEIEGAHCADANEIEQRAFYAQVREGLVQALEDPVPSTDYWCVSAWSPLTLER